MFSYKTTLHSYEKSLKLFADIKMYVYEYNESMLVS